MTPEEIHWHAMNLFEQLPAVHTVTESYRDVLIYLLEQAIRLGQDGDA